MTTPTEALARAIATQDQLREFIGKHGQEDTATFLLIEADAAISALCASLAAQPAPAPDAVPVGEVYRAHAGGRTRSIGFDAARLYEGANVAPGTKLYAGAAPVAKVAEPVLQDIEQYRMQMAGISTAALGYWTEADGIHPDYDTVPLRDVAKLYAKYAALHAAAHPQHPAPQPLTEAQIHAMKLAAADQGITGIAPSLHLARAVEAWHGISAAQVAPAADKGQP